jgi:hypothetical protein
MRFAKIFALVVASAVAAPSWAQMNFEGLDVGKKKKKSSTKKKDKEEKADKAEEKKD